MLLFLFFAWTNPVSAATIADDPWQDSADEQNGAPPFPGGGNLRLFAGGKVRDLPQIREALASFEAGDYERTVQLLEEAREKHASLPPARVVLAWLFLSARQVEPARLALEQAAVEAPAHPHVYLTFGQIALGEGRLTDAWLQFEKAKSGTWAGAQQEALRINILDGLVTVAERRGDWSAAEAVLTDWLKSAPKEAGVQARLGRALFYQGQENKAFEMLQQAAGNDPRLDRPEVTVAALHRAAGRMRETTDWLERARKRYPEDPRVYIAIADHRLMLGDGSGAREAADKAARFGPDSRELTMLRGLIAHQLGDYAAAERLFEGLYQAAPGDAVASNRLALALAEQENPDKRQRALQLAEVNVRQFPRNVEVHATLGRVRYRLGRIDQAEQTLRAVATSGQMTSDAAYYLARVLADKGETSEAKRFLDSALDSGPGFFSYRRQAEKLRDELG